MMKIRPRCLNLSLTKKCNEDDSLDMQNELESNIGEHIEDRKYKNFEVLEGGKWGVIKVSYFVCIGSRCLILTIL